MRRRIDQGRANDSDILTASFTIACEIYHYHGLYAKNDTDYPRQWCARWRRSANCSFEPGGRPKTRPNWREPRLT